MNVLQQITSDIHALIHLIWNKSFKSKTNRQDFVETRVTHIFWTHWKARETRTGRWHLHPYANTNTSTWICIRDYKHRNTWCNPGPQTANTRLRQSLDNTNVINVWRLSTTAPDTQHRQILIKVQIYKTTLYQDDTGPTWSMGRKRKEGTEGVQYRCIYREIEGSQRMRWCEHLPTYIWISMVPSSSGHIHGNSKEWRSGEKISSWGTFSPLSFKFHV